jgi:hypothetical protein
MHTKTRSTLAGFTAATLFVLSVWLFGQPIGSVAPNKPFALAHVSIASDPGSRAAPGIRDDRYSTRISMAMPYFSFALLRSRKGIN